MKNRLNKITRGVTTFIIAIILVQVPSGVLAESKSKFNTTKVNQGLLIMEHQSDETLIAIVTKGEEREQYILGEENKSIPLQLGSGEYGVQIVRNIEGNTYITVGRIDITADINQEQVYLNSTSEVNFDSNMKAIKKAEEITKHLKTDEEKIKTIYNYVAKNIRYDDDKVKSLKNTYLPKIDSTLTSKKGICYDYASLTASMLRSQGIQTRLVKGYKNDMGDVYHAWNEVLVGNQWKIIDTTYDNPYYREGQPVNMYKAPKDYRVTGRY